MIAFLATVLYTPFVLALVGLADLSRYSLGRIGQSGPSTSMNPIGNPVLVAIVVAVAAT
jgi:hypothetical protein